MLVIINAFLLNLTVAESIISSMASGVLVLMKCKKGGRVRVVGSGNTGSASRWVFNRFNSSSAYINLFIMAGEFSYPSNILSAVSLIDLGMFTFRALIADIKRLAEQY